VSPHNIILSYEGTVKLLDFGVAMSAVTEQAATMIVGKWLYMSSEHTANQKIDHRSDLFSLGVITYLLCTGKMPFSGSDPKEIVRKIRSGQHKPLREHAPDLPEALSQLVSRMLSPNPDERPQTGHEVVATLNEITRSYGFESSATAMANLLANVFPEEPVDTDGVVEIIRTNRSNTFSQQPLSPSSLSPGSSPQRLTPSVLSAADVSVSLARAPSRELPLPRADVHRNVEAIKLQASGWAFMTKSVMLVILICLLALVTYYLIARPI
jgi:serine/threonine protein kinase